MRIVKCSAYGSFSRQFVQFVLTSRLAKDLLEWSRQVYSPDESYWCMLNYNRIEPAPGGHSGNPDDNPWLSSYSVWKGEKYQCHTVFIRRVCIFSPSDLPFLASLPSLFANKLMISYQPAALHCLDQRIFNKTLSRTPIDKAMYEDLLKNRHHRGNDTLFEKISGLV
ncbi:beta-1,3-galactosyl-O-glycosyl-glycoprotein beta-1,6-N-acetylglucosaminyltransferase-like [Elysia marginata]|uniref:Beta-1,3-galactosyl-O-glycosyl-glycoprotein beta-1,6-N-acetylglucosaminyltransferase-like n=1 Tax=Elysia marginata TaxID=1093978 RepID=A0AAV4EQ67_9GAST|nr:beta-1,3-galactosyl-O-glycosyl-glycoprotein beta-1,6-N-acetylglucosaminyltransferase-like [Elysia marginata]